MLSSAHHKLTGLHHTAQRHATTRLPHPTQHVELLRDLGVCVTAGGSTISAQLSTHLFQGSKSEGAQTGSGAVAAALQQYLAAAAVDAAGSACQCLTLSQGEITCLRLAELPGLRTALGIVGTTVGSVLLFLVTVDGVQPMAELPLWQLSEGRVSAADAVQTVEIGLDPAGRAEFFAAATAHCLVLLDTLLLEVYLAPAAEGAAGHNLLRHAMGKASAGSAGAAAVRPALPTVRRTQRSDPLVVVLPDTQGIVKLLAPTRYNAAFAMDVALLVLLDNGGVRYVSREVRGGSRQLLFEHHMQRQASDTMAAVARLEESFYFNSSVQNNASSKNNQNTAKSEVSLLTNPQGMAHIEYRYALSERKFFFDVTTRPSDYFDNSTAHHHQRHSRSHPNAPADGILVNDGQLFFNPVTGNMSLVAVGAHLASHAHHSEGPSSRGAPAAATATGWWGVAMDAVLPRLTLANEAVKDTFYTQHGTPGPAHAELLNRFAVRTTSGVVRLRRERTGDGLPTSPPSSSSQLPSSPMMAGPAAAWPASGTLASVAVLTQGPYLVFTSGNDVYHCVFSELLQTCGSAETSARADSAGRVRVVPSLPALVHIYTAGSVVEAVCEGAPWWLAASSSDQGRAKGQGGELVVAGLEDEEDSRLSGGAAASHVHANSHGGKGPICLAYVAGSSLTLLTLE